ncbi:anhydro-N-acetylmuramic acid kinase [Alteromonadaceae bacterium BrNp21-10]|nr:anhydro-N-acetylmuramic acid kinase [Alteromonadaceae bacterium BrNp21-10]
MAGLYIGLMSGTSMDGIDAALVDFSDTNAPTLLDYSTYQYPKPLLDELHALSQPGDDEIQRMGVASRQVGKAFADAVQQLLKRNSLIPSQVQALGSHGQTIRHFPDKEHGYSLQIGDANTIAVNTGIDVIADFRNKDIALGGQGAPLVPAFHHSVFAHPQQPRSIVNIGGIANITQLSIKDDIANIRGYDTGPGNTLMDAWIKQHLDKAYDKDGQWAASGSVHEQLLASLLAHPYFAEPAPKSTGREDFHLVWLQQILTAQPDEITPEDVQATLLALTVQTIADCVGDTEVFICGGGAYNSQLMQALQQALAPRTVTSTLSLGIAPDAVEAMAFAWLAYAHQQGIHGNIPAVTGANRSAILGGYYPAG